MLRSLATSLHSRRIHAVKQSSEGDRIRPDVGHQV